MSLQDIQDEAQSLGGAWAKLKAVGDRLVGKLITLDVRDRTTPKGDIVYKGKTDEPRKVWVLTLQTDERDPENPDDDGIRKFGANESAQVALKKAINDARKAAPGFAIAKGDDVGLKVTSIPDAGEFAQMEYKAQWTIDQSRDPNPVEEAPAAQAPSPGSAFEYDEEPF